MSQHKRPFDVVPVIILLVLAGIMLGGWWLFPKVQAWMAHDNCVAAGHTNCA
jgi:hypothetical protein